LCIEREIDVNGEFMCLGRIYLDAERFSEILNLEISDLDNTNIRALLRQNYDVPTVRITEQVGAEIFALNICDLLKLKKHTTGLVCHILGYEFRGAPISYQVVYLPPHARRLEIRPRTN
jgi:GntR family transcriptional regulator